MILISIKIGLRGWRRSWKIREVVKLGGRSRRKGRNIRRIKI
jgi:hypothetical protein